MGNYIGTSQDHINAAVQNRFFYGLRRTDEGELFIGKVDQLKTEDSLTLNVPGDPTANYPDSWEFKVEEVKWSEEGQRSYFV